MSSPELVGNNSFASFYDYYDGAEYRAPELAMYRAIADESGGPILELGCGTGIIAIHLAQAGFHVTGLDIATDMLDVARQKLSNESPEVRSHVSYVQGDMKDLSLTTGFRLVLLPNDCFGYLLAPEDRLNCLKAVHKHLLPGGRVVIAVRHYTPEVLVGIQQRRGAITIQAASTNKATGLYTHFCWSHVYLDVVTHTIHSTRYIDEVQADGQVKRLLPSDGGPTRQHYFDRYELWALLTAAGFHIKDVWGSPTRSPLQAQSYSIIVLAEKG